MAVFTDGIHLVADEVHELHAFARAIGLSRKHFVCHNHKYYPLIGSMVNKAILAGAQVKDTRFLVTLKINNAVRKRTMIILG